jgi:hypothetical protein
LLYRRTSLSSERECQVKEAFSNCCSNEKEQLADDFVKEAKREGLNQLAERPDGQHALAEVYRLPALNVPSLCGAYTESKAIRP